MDAARDDIDAVFPASAFKESFKVPVAGGDYLYDEVYEGFRLEYDLPPELSASPRFVPATFEDCTPIGGGVDKEIHDKLDSVLEKLNDVLARLPPA